MRFSKFISYFFQPINFSILGAFIYFLWIPKHIFKLQEYFILSLVFIGTYLFPLLALLALKKFNVIYSYQMRSVEERKFPLLLFMLISYSIGNWLFKAATVDLLALFYFGYTLALFIAYILLHFKIKASLHAGAISGLIGFLIYFSYHYKTNLLFVLACLFLLAGIIGTSRLRLKAHTLKELFWAYSIGFFTQIISYLIYIL